MNTPEDKRHLAAAFMVGGALGAGIALLYAPQSGRKTRRDLRRISQKAMNDAETLQTKLRQSVHDLATDTFEKIREEFTRGPDWTEKRADEVQSVIERGRDFIVKELDKVGSM
jgi:gas vesicle protein